MPDLYEVFANDHTLVARSPNWPEKQGVLPPKGERWIATYVVNGIAYRAIRLEHIPILDREGNEPAKDFLRITYASPVIR